MHVNTMSIIEVSKNDVDDIKIITGLPMYRRGSIQSCPVASITAIQISAGYSRSPETLTVAYRLEW